MLGFDGIDILTRAFISVMSEFPYFANATTPTIPNSPPRRSSHTYTGIVPSTYLNSLHHNFSGSRHVLQIELPHTLIPYETQRVTDRLGSEYKKHHKAFTVTKLLCKIRIKVNMFRNRKLTGKVT